MVIAAFVTLKEVLEKQQPVLDAIDTLFTSIGLAINKVVDAVKESGEGFDSLKEVLSNLNYYWFSTIKGRSFLQLKGLFLSAQLAWESSFFGGQDEEKIAELKQDIADVGQEFVNIKDGVVDAAKGIADNLGDAITEVAAVGSAISDLNTKAILEEAKATTALKNNAAIREALNKGIFESYDRQAELLRQTRDDERLTIEERQEANNKLADVLKEQEKIMLENANAVVVAAQAELKANETTENRVALIEAQNELEAIKADITGRQSEQLINKIALEKEIDEREQTKLEEQAEKDEAEKERLDKIAQDNIDRAKTEADQLKAIEEAKAQVRGASVDGAVGALKTLAALDEDNRALQAASLIAENASGIAKTIQNTVVANA